MVGNAYWQGIPWDGDRLTYITCECGWYGSTMDLIQHTLNGYCCCPKCDKETKYFRGDNPEVPRLEADE